MTINILILKGDLNGENRSGAFLLLSGISCPFLKIEKMILNMMKAAVVIGALMVKYWLNAN